MVDNPFGSSPSITDLFKPPEMPKVEEPILPVDEEAFVRERDDETPLQVVQRILAAYNGIESDIPIILYEYWSAKRSI